MPFKSNRASKLTILQYLKSRYSNATYLELWHISLGATAPCHTFLESSFNAQHFQWGSLSLS